MGETYKIIGGDGQEYGPVDENEIKEWISEGRIAGETKVLPESIRHWIPVSDLKEFKSDFTNQAKDIEADVSLVEDSSPEELISVGFSIRLVSHFVDSMITCLLTLLVYGAPPDDILTTFSAWTVVQCGIFGVYRVYFHTRYGATPGKMLIRARVVDYEGHSITWQQAILRYVGFIISAFYFGIGFLVMIFDKRKRGIHDMISKTRVVYRS
jgi:uncharacterized RDD family membrane protein YckC